MNWKYLLIFINVISLVIHVRGVCTPNDVKNDLTKCLQDQHLYTFYQFPIVPRANQTALCSNSTCLAYCMETIIQACQSHAFTSHLGMANAIKAAYLGFCADNHTLTVEALGCTESIANQDALNVISAFETAIQSYYVDNNVNNATLCSNWTSMKTGLDALVTTACSSNTVGKTLWETFLNTLIAPCVTSTPSYYDSYSSISVHTCNRGPATGIYAIVICICIISGLLLPGLCSGVL